MQFRIELPSEIDPVIKEKFVEYLYDCITNDLHDLVNKYYPKYKARENNVLSSTLIKWIGKVPSHLNLPYYIENCLILSYSHGTYIIKVNDRWLIKGSLTPVRLLVKMLEYGASGIYPLPVIRRLLRWYSDNYLNLFPEFVEERIGDIL